MIKRKGSKVGIRTKLPDVYHSLAREIGIEVHSNWCVVDVRKSTLDSLRTFCQLMGWNAMREIRRSFKEAYMQFDENILSRIPYKRDLFAHQKEALFYAYHQKDFFLFFEQGLGKTITAITIATMLKGRTVIVSPSIVKYQWMREQVDKWNFNELDFTILDRKEKFTIRGFSPRFIVANYEMVHRFQDELLDMDNLIVDEAHYIKNHTAKRSKMLKQLRDDAGKPNTYLLTGTPITNKIDDVFGYFHFIDHPLASSYQRFLNRYAVQDGSKIIGSQNRKELRSRIMAKAIRRRTDECVDLPPIILKKNYIPFAELEGDVYVDTIKKITDQRSRIDEIDKELEQADEERKKELKEERSQLMMTAKNNIHTLNKITANSKVGHIVEVIRDLEEKGRKCVVFSPYYLPLDNIMKEVGKDKCAMITGRQSSMQKEMEKNDFLGGNKSVMLANVKAGGMGINLVNCKDVIFAGLPFTPDQIEQPYKRVHRMGQKNTVNVRFVMIESTVDDHIYSMIEDKIGDIQKVMDLDKKNIDYSSIEEDLLRSLTKNQEQ